MRADITAASERLSRREAIEEIRRGLPVSKIEQLMTSGRLSMAEVDRIVLPRKTLGHRRKIGTLTPDQSDRVMRVARTITAAEATFGSQKKAFTWLRRPTEALAGDAPLELLDTTEGTRQVEQLLHRIDHGLAA